MKKVVSLLHNDAFLFFFGLTFIFVFVAIVVTCYAIVNGVRNDAALSIIVGFDMLAAVGIWTTFDAAKL